MKDKRKMDANKVWQWRIMRAKKYSRRPQPFYHSNRIGLDFNVASSTKKKLDLQLVTNGVILEVCDFAKTVNKSKSYFITNILENNFDLGLENEQQRIDFTARILHKVKDLIRKPPRDKNEVFTLFDTSSKPEFNSNDGLNMASTELTESFLVEMDDTDDSELEDEFKCSQATSKEYIKTERLSEEIGGAHGDDSEHGDELKCSETQSARELKEDVLPPSFPYCEEIGLYLDVGSKQSLDPGLLTKGVMLELVHLSRILTASYSPIVLGVLEHNFELDLKSQQGKSRVWFKISQLLKRRKQRITTGSKISPEFKNEQFSFHTNPFKRTRGSALSNMEAPQYQFKEVTKRRQSDLKCKQKKRFLLTTSERANKRCRRRQSKDMETNALSHHTDLSTSRTAEGDHCHTCPQGEYDLDSNTGNEGDMEQEEMETENNHIRLLGESDLDSDKVTDSGNSSNREHLVSSSLPTVNSNVNPPYASQPDKRGLGGGEEQTQSSKHSPNKYDMDQEEMGKNNNMWKLRANRVNQILSPLEFGPFNWSKKIGLDFNVGFGPKQNISIDSLLDSALLEVAKFALAMNSSQQNFIMEILEYNFDIDLQSEYQRNVVPCEVMNRVRQLKECEDAVKFSKEVFELPGFMPSINITNPSMGNVKEECDDVPVCPPHSHAETKEHISQKSVDLYPFCKKIGLKLHVNSSRPNKKLDINKLTNGAMTEVTNFAEKLCGTFEQICLDILGHNFDLDLQSGDSDLARNILARIPAIVDQRNLSNCVGTEGKLKGPRMVKLDCQNNRNVGACSAHSPQAGLVHQDVSSSTDIEYQNEDNLKLWQLRANHIQQILSIPHEEHCPFYSYSRCKKLGIDFNVGFGAKQNLDPKLLTNGIMAELNTFATTMLSAQKYFITDILECNFDLDLKNELYRSTFAQQTLHRVRTLNTRKKYSKPRINNIFELPDMRSIQKSTIYCPKCYQDRNHKLRQDESDPGHMHHPYPHTMTDAVSADANCTAQKSAKDPSSTFSAIEETLMDSYPCCKKIGLKLCVDKDQRKDKLDMHLLTRGVMNEVIRFTKKLCGTKIKIVNDVLEHNFNIGMQGREISPAALFQRVTGQNNGPAWFSEVFVVHQYTRRAPGYVSKEKRAAAMHQSERQEAVKKRQLSLRAKEERATLSSHNISVGKSKTNPQSKGNCFPIFKGIGLDRDMTSKSGKKEQLDLKLLTRPVCDMEQEEIRAENYNTCPLGESDLDSDEVTDSEDAGNQDHLQNPKRCSLSSDIPRESESSYLGVCAPFLPTTDVSSSLPTVNPNVNPPFARQPDERGLCGIEEQTQSSRHSPNKYDMDQEEMGTNNNMWKLRANRVNQILSALEFRPFYWSKKNGLDFNVGFGPKQNISIDSLLDSALLEVAKFALAMNSSQQNFIMEILEYNFDIDLQSEYQRNVVPCEVMNRVRQLKECEDAVKFSKEVFELPGFMPSINITNPSMGNVKEECDDVPVCPPHSHAETKEHISQKSVDLYPFCKEIDLKLHVNSSRPNKKLDINKLTNGAMTEVTNFAEKLCGTFEQICLDILGHNFDLDLQRGDSDLARNILARIPAIVDQRNLSNCAGTEGKVKSPRMVKLYCQNNLNVGACNARSSQAGIIHQDVSSSTDIEYQNEDNLKLWQLRANHIQQILSIPHEEHCPFYSYSKCKKLGIDFNVGFGAKQNLDPKLLTNGIMVELNTFATAMLSAQKYFITDILECNFDLDLKNELYRSAFAQQTINKVQALNAHKKYSKPLMNKPFELPDMRSILKSTTYCPKCYQDRNHKLRQDESDPDHMHHPCPLTMTDAVSADANCTAQKSAKDPSSTFLAIEETLMDSYPRCKKIGLKLCVVGDQRKDKLDMHLLTRGVMNEVISFTKKLCGTKIKIVNDVLEHNFNIGMQGREISPAALFQRVTKQNNGPAWFSEVLVIQQYTRRAPGYVSKEKRAAAMHQSERQEAVKKRQLSLRAKEERATLSSHNISVGKSMTNPQSKGNCIPIIKGICLDQDMTSKSGKKEQLDLKLFTRPMCDMEQEEIRAENYYTCPLGESDLDSDEVTDSEDAGNQDHLQNPKCFPLSSDIARESESSYLGVCEPFLPSTDVSSSLPTVNSNVNLPFASQPDERGLCGSEKQTQTPGNASNECDMDQEEMGTENNMWKLRANRVNQILSALEFGPFNWSKKIGLDFNVGFGPKQNISIDSLLDSALLEVAKFALAMNSSQQNFIMEILEYNFDFYLQSEYQRNVVPCEVMNRVRQLKECEDAVKFSKEVFELPGFMPSINITNPSMGNVKEECDDVPVCPPRSHADTKEHMSQSVDLYPFCKEIGLKLHVNTSRPYKKLDISKLTNGAMTETEIISFVRMNLTQVTCTIPVHIP
ncbi:uncharacterized protein LOC119477430 [Sebastes umbrosus]|uniref:uncharacterized protein LOC119477430 n=1 Tax=Sebastes umbrosus TaxID=72105 RepID=UPI00189F36AF|nr:uncharacterized protein LOC119477430 [Sebastes umbrosus]